MALITKVFSQTAKQSEGGKQWGHYYGNVFWNYDRYYMLNYIFKLATIHGLNKWDPRSRPVIYIGHSPLY